MKQSSPLRVFPLGILLFFAFAFPLQAAEYTYNQEYSQIIFTLKQIRLVVAAGHFEDFSGTFSFDAARIENSRVDLRIFTKSLKAQNKMQDKLLRSKNFFSPEQYPEITFVSREFKNIQGKEFDIHGDLTIRGVTKAVIFKTKLMSDPGTITGKHPLRFQSYTFIRRKDFHLGTGNLLDPVIALSRESLKITLEVVGTPAEKA